jgi:hypothetical protein
VGLVAAGAAIAPAGIRTGTIAALANGRYQENKGRQNLTSSASDIVDLLHVLPGDYRLARRSLSALPTTLTDESAIAAAAMTGDSNSPIAG